MSTLLVVYLKLYVMGHVLALVFVLVDWLCKPEGGRGR